MVAPRGVERGAPVAIAGNVPSLIVLIAIVGLFSGAMIPIANTLIDAWAPPEIEGEWLMIHSMMN